MSKYCTGCGNPLEPGLVFCTNCGKKIEPDAPAQSAQPQQPVSPPAQQQGYPNPASQPADRDNYRTVQVSESYTQPQYSQPVQAQPQYSQPAQAQPQYQTAPAYGGQAPEPPAKKSKKGLIIGGVAVIAAVVVLLILFVFKDNDQKSADASSSTSSSAAAADKTEAEEEVMTEEENEEATEKSSGGLVKDEYGFSDEFFFGEDDIKLTVWTSESAEPLTKSLCEDFIALYPNKSIEINIEVMSEGEAATNLLNDSDAAADVFGFAGDQLGKLQKSGAISFAAFPDEIKPRDSEASIKAATIDDKIYAYPMTCDNSYYLVYDKSVISDEDAASMEGILAACKKAGKKMVIESGNGFYSCMYAFTGGLSLEGTDSEGVQQFNSYNEDNVVASLCAFAKLFSEYSDVLISKEVAAICNGFKDGTVAAGFEGNWNTAADMQALGDNFGAAKLPTINVDGEDKRIVPLGGYKLMGVNAHSAFPNAAQLLANYLTEEDAQRRRAEELMWGPTNKAVMETDAVTGSPALKALAEQAEYAVPMSDMSDTFWSPMATLGNYVAKGESDASAMKKEFEKAITNIKDE